MYGKIFLRHEMKKFKQEIPFSVTKGRFSPKIWDKQQSLQGEKIGLLYM